MADDKNSKNKGNRLKFLIDTFRAGTKLATERLYGTSEKYHDDISSDLTDIKNVINDITNKYTKNTGPDILEFFNAVYIDKNQRKQKITSNLQGAKNQLMNMNSLFANPDSYNINEIFSQESGRFQMYNSYRLIYENIPQMTQALSTYIDNILSPDDFTKNIFNVYINNNIITNIKNTDKYSDVIDNCNMLIEQYKLETFGKRVMTDALKIGDQFVAVLNMANEMERLMISEDVSSEALITSENVYEDLTIDDVILTESEIAEIGEFVGIQTVPMPVAPTKVSKYGLISEEDKTLLAKYEEQKRIYNESNLKIKKSIVDCINKNIVFCEDSKILAEDNFEIAKEFSSNVERMYGRKDPEALSTLFLKDGKRRKRNEQIKVNGSVLKILKPERVVKLSLDDYCYGYYYIENLENSPDYLTTGTYSINSNIFNNFKSQEFDQPDMVNAKYRLITDVFVRNISRKINKKVINNNPEFKETIYNLLKQNYILNKQVRIVYLGPSEVIHFGIGTEEYKDSIYKPILFSAKLYLAVLTSQVMLRLVRSPEKRVYYIECDLDNDTEAVVQSFIRDSKTKEIKMSNFGGDINTLLNNIGTYQDYYIPVVNGQKPLEVDSLPGMNVDITNDFLEYLLKTMISGMGIPPEYLSYAEQTEFARSLGMMNGKFVRSIIVYQKVFGEQFTELFRMLYKNEFMNEFSIKDKQKLIKQHLSSINSNKTDETIDTDTSEEREKVKQNEIDNKLKLFDLNTLEVKFPSPQSLNMTTMQEQSGAAKEMAEFIATTLLGENNQDANLKDTFKTLLLQDTLPNFNWKKYNQMLENARVENSEKGLSQVGDTTGGSPY